MELRCKNHPVTVNPYHAGIQGENTKAFSCKDLVGKKGLNEVVAKQVSKTYGIPMSELHGDYEAFSTHMPYGVMGDAAHRLLGQQTNTPFNTFLSRAVFRHPTSVLTSLRRSQDQLHVGGFLSAIWFGLHVVTPYLKVSVFFSTLHLLTGKKNRTARAHLYML